MSLTHFTDSVRGEKSLEGEKLEGMSWVKQRKHVGTGHLKTLQVPAAYTHMLNAQES